MHKIDKMQKIAPKKTLDRDLIYRILLVIIVFIVMSPAMNNNFINWDDEPYITKNEVVKKAPFSNLEEIFTHKINNFSVPLTLLSFQIEYYFFGLNPFPYHFNNLLLHLLNVVLMYFFIRKLVVSPTETSQTTAFFVALLFGIHPMNVESVAWATERKDLLYTFFALLTLLQYVYIIENQSAKILSQLKSKHYWLSILFFVLSLLSKPQAIFLPALLLLIDYWKQPEGKNVIWSVLSPSKLFSKFPYFIISFLAGLYLLLNVGTKVYEKSIDYTFFEKFLFSCYQIGLYLVKFFFPFQLSNFYEYPTKSGSFYPMIFYITPFVLIGLLSWLFWKFRTNKAVIFGLLFYFANIFIFLQVFSVNTGIAYERFNYLAYNGLFFIVVIFLQRITLTDLGKLGLFAYLLLFGVLSFQRCKIWQNDIVFFADMARKNPNNVDANKIAIKNMADELMEKNQIPAAIEKFTQAMGKDINYEQAYLGRAYAYFISKRYAEAILDYNKALTLGIRPDERNQVIFNRGTCFMNLQNYPQAITDFNALISIAPNYVSAYLNRAFCFGKSGDYERAIADYQTVLQIEPTNAIAVQQLGLIRGNMK
ncbi:MAG: tetratricopeptide repeat protein [Cytophagales bacterium]|nr:MAG: tetratricopeptide repeat protein [Cytophagales bacterium]